MLAKPLVYKPLFVVLSVIMAIAFVPSAVLRFAAPNWEFAQQARKITASFVRLAREPGAKRETPYFLPGDAEFSWEPGGHWTLGFAKRNLTESPEVRENIKNGVYRVAGFGPNKSTDIMDDMFSKVIYLDDNTGRGGLLYAVIDCVGISNTDANAIRALVWDWAREKGVKSIQIAATHAHACIDTIGMWGIPFDGKVPAFQQLMIEKTAQAMKEAYENRQDGKLFMATAASNGFIVDNRPPAAFEPLITRFRFEPLAAGAKEFFILSAGVHPETTGGGNTVISADFPAYAAKYISENRDGAETIFIQGALGAMVTVRDLRTYSDDRLALVRAGGAEFAQYALGEGENSSVSDETELPALLNIASAEYELPIENLLFIMAMKVGIINHAGYSVRGKSYKYATTCELSYLRLGDKNDSVDILLVPGEPAPELFLGGFLGAEDSALRQEYPRRPIFEYLADYEFASERKIVFGMANNFTGYVIPDNDHLTHKWLPYILEGEDPSGRGHYEETNSAGPQTAGVLTEAFCGLFDQVKG